MFVDTHNVDPRQALRILSDIVTANDDVVDETRFAMWAQSIYLAMDPTAFGSRDRLEPVRRV